MERQGARGSRGHLQLLAAPVADQPVAAAHTAAHTATHTVATEVANALAAASETALLAPLALPLALSVCMQRHGLDIDGLVEAMRALRLAVLEVAGMDRAHEPVPLSSGEPGAAALAMADYLVGLIRRAVRASGSSPDDLATAAAARLAA